MQQVPAEEIRRHVSRFQRALQRESIDSALMLQGADMFYLSGTVQDGVLCVPAAGEPVLFVRRSFQRAEADVAYGKVVSFSRFSQLKTGIAEAGVNVGSRVGVEMDVLPVTTFQRLEKPLASVEFVDVSGLILACRAEKTEYEIEMLRKAGEIACRTFEQIPELIEEDMAEFELAAEIERAARMNGHPGAVRFRKWNANVMTIAVSSGKNACVPNFFDGPVGSPGISPAVPVGAGTKRIARNEPIIIDTVFASGGYCVDITRVFAIGQLDNRLLAAHALARRIIRQTEKRLTQGAMASDIYNEAAKTAQDSPFAAGFMGVGDGKVSFLGHGVGLEVDEMPVLAPQFQQPLQTSNVLAVEPKFFFEKLGGVGVENTYVVSRQRCENLTPVSEEIIIM